MTRGKYTRMTYKKTGLTHYVGEHVYRDGTRSTFCAMDVKDEEWSDDPALIKRVCKRCRVASGVSGRLVYNYGAMAWKRDHRY